MTMKYEHVFAVKDATAVPLNPIDLASVGFMERQHLQEWILANPRVLGEDIMIVAVEFDRWQSFTGDSKKDRLDILAIDSSGRLVVVELKRGPATSHVDLQVLKYAAAVSRFDPETLVDAYRRYLKSRGEDVTQQTAEARLAEFTESPPDLETLRQPRIILIAQSFDESVTNTVVWLSESNIDIVLMRYQLYQTSSDPVFVVSQMYPTPETEEFILTPRREEVEQVKAKTKTERRQRDAVKVLAEERALEPGTRLHLEPSGVNEELRSAVEVWLAEDPSRAEGEWTGVPAAPVKWAHTGERGKPSTLATRVLENATGIRRALNGAMWWLLDDGQSLADLAAQYVDAKKATKDWSLLHAVMAALPEDRWTTYGDLAEIVDTAPMPVGQHLKNCPECLNAENVLNADGKSVAGFTWSDPTKTLTQRQVLEAKGISFGPDGCADPAQRLSASDLRGLLDEA